MQNYLLPLHKSTAGAVDYLGFATGNLLYIVKIEADGVYTDRFNYSYFFTNDKAVYTAAIEDPSSVTFTQDFPMGQEINFDFLFNF